MKWNEHYAQEGAHAFLSASKYHWIRYDDEKLVDSYRNFKAVEYGTRLHAFASECIQLTQKLPRSNKTLNSFVNDAIGFGMESERVLFYSENCFGTADAISFNKGVLRIHDLKTGKIPAHMEQLYIYAALFCLEYKVKPAEIEIICRIYQNDEIIEDHPEVDDILPIMDKIIHFDKILRKEKEA